MNYYNENDPKAAAWLRELIKAGQIPDGFVDERSIVDVEPKDLNDYIQCHFFAGIGGWSCALRLAGWPDSTPVWTGSCPCQPFSQAGKGMGIADERHLWPYLRNLVGLCRPPVVFGEQVAAKAGREWLSRVRLDLEALGYGVGCADLCAAGEAAPHIRQRLYWVADNNSPQRRTSGEGLSRQGRPQQRPTNSGKDGGLAHPGHGTGRPEQGDELPECDSGIGEPGEVSGGVGHAEHAESTRQRCVSPTMESQQKAERPSNATAWSNSIFIQCSDGKQRRIEPRFFPLAHGIPGRVGLLRGYGNAIVPQVAATFIRAYAQTI